MAFVQCFCLISPNFISIEFGKEWRGEKIRNERVKQSQLLGWKTKGSTIFLADVARWEQNILNCSCCFDFPVSKDWEGHLMQSGRSSTGLCLKIGYNQIHLM